MVSNQEKPIDASRLIEFVRTLHDHYASYHDHKESMAYAGLTLFIGIVGTGLFADKWPPKPASQWSVVAVVLVWAAVLTYLKFQLIRRRWAALRESGCERLLARWTVEDPAPEDMK